MPQLQMVLLAKGSYDDQLNVNVALACPCQNALTNPHNLFPAACLI